MNEQQAVRRLKRGDWDGLAFLVRQHQLIAIRTAFLIVRDRGIAEDIVQTAFVRVFERRQQFDEKRPFLPWFLRIISNDAIKAVTRGDRARQIDISSTDIDDTYLDQWRISLPDPEWEAERAELKQIIWEAMADLSPEQRAAVLMRYYLDYSEAEISQQTDSPKGTVKWRLHAARQKLRHILQPLLLDSNQRSESHES